MVAAIAINVVDPVFESQTKTRLGSRDMKPEGPTIAKYIGDFIRKELDNYLHRELDVADIILKKVQASERDRKAMAGVAKKARDCQEGQPLQPQAQRLPRAPQRHPRQRRA